MKITQIGPAVAITALLGATWAVPAAISAATPTPEDSVKTVGSKTTLEGMQGDKVTFTSPRGWTTPRSSSHQSKAFSQGDKSIDVSLLDGSDDFETTSKRVVRNLSNEGVAVVYDGGRITSKNGFEGKTCTAVVAAAQAAGRCAVVHKGGVVVTIISTDAKTGPTQDAMKSVDTIVDTLELKKEG